VPPQFILKRASASRPSGEWNDDDYDVLAEGRRRRSHLQSQRRARRKPPGCGRSPSATTRIAPPTNGYAETREAAMAAFAKSWRRL
jgi:hypothetical protein